MRNVSTLRSQETASDEVLRTKEDLEHGGITGEYL